MIAQGGAYSALGGLRRRYQYFSYERCGQSFHFFVTPNCVQHQIGGVVPSPLREVREPGPALAEISRLQSTAPLHFCREKGRNTGCCFVPGNLFPMPPIAAMKWSATSSIKNSAEISEFRVKPGYEDALYPHASMLSERGRISFLFHPMTPAT